MSASADVPAGVKQNGAVTPRLMMGIFITLVGALLLLDNLNLFEARQVLRLWPLAIVALGVLVFTQAVEAGGRINGGVMIVVGGLLTLNRLGILEFEFWNLFWPLMLILIGVNLVLQNFRIPPGIESADTVSLFAVWGGSQRTSNAAEFRGGDMTAIMGGCELDLRQANISDGNVATIDLLAVMGGHVIRVPEDWSVQTRVIPFMGGVDEKRPTAKPGSSKTLVLRGFIMMGGLEIKT